MSSFFHLFLEAILGHSLGLTSQAIDLWADDLSVSSQRQHVAVKSYTSMSNGNSAALYFAASERATSNEAESNLPESLTPIPFSMSVRPATGDSGNLA